MAISYTKTNWQDAPSTATPITAAQLNRMEKGIDDCKGQSNSNELAIKANAEAIQTLESGIQLGSISISDLLLMAHPVGSIYMTTSSTSPAQTFGGTWERIKGKFIWGIDDDETAGVTGGEKTHTLTEAELPVIDGRIATAVVGSHTTKGVTGNAYGTDFGPVTKPIVGAEGKAGDVQYGYGYKFGGGKAHNNMPPYYGAYIWRRTA